LDTVILIALTRPSEIKNQKNWLRMKSAIVKYSSNKNKKLMFAKICSSENIPFYDIGPVLCKFEIENAPKVYVKMHAALNIF